MAKMNLDEDVPHFSSYINTQTGQSPKVDPAIIYAILQLIKLSAKPYINQTGRKYKYLAMRDIILTQIDPPLVPKMSEPEWAKRYFELMADMKNTNRLMYSLEYFQDTIQKLMQLFYVVLYSNGYYELESLDDDDYMEMIKWNKTKRTGY